MFGNCKRHRDRQELTPVVSVGGGRAEVQVVADHSSTTAACVC